MTEKNYKNPMGYKEIFPLLIKMSLPIMLSMLIQALYNITDSYFVAKMSEKAFRATSLSYPIQIVIIGFGVGTGVGISSFMARALGSGKEKRARQGAMHGMLMVFFAWSIFLLFRIFLMDSFFDFFTTDPEVKSMGLNYLGLISTFSFLSLMQITLEKILQSTGQMVKPMIVQAIGAITNIILDPIMIFGLFGFPAMGIRGAAIATLIGQCMAALTGLIFVFSKNSGLNIDLREFKFSPSIVKEIYRVGFPSIVMQSVTAFVTITLNLIIIRYSELAVSVLGIYFKLESFVLMPVQGLSQGFLPLVAYNYGAKNKDRIDLAYKKGLQMALGLMAAGTLLFQLIPGQLISIFTKDPEMINMGIYTLRTISLGYVLAAVGIINSTYFQSLGLGNYSLLATLLRQVIIIIPLAYVFSFYSLNLVWFAYPIAEVVATIVSVILQRKARDKCVLPLGQSL